MASAFCLKFTPPVSSSLATQGANLKNFKSNSSLRFSIYGNSLRFQKKAVNVSFKPSSFIPINAEVKYLNVQEAKNAVDSEGYTIVDIRDQSQYDRAHISNSLHIPLFIENTDSDIGTAIKRQAHNNFAGFLYGLAFTKQNENFLKEFETKFSKDEKLLLVCQEGLRSGTAVEVLEGRGFENVAILTSGLQNVPTGMFPTAGKKELKDAGKGGFVAIQTQFSIVLATLLIGAILVLQFFPDLFK